MEDYLKSFWEKYSLIHNATKELYILCEEYDDEMSSFIQPIKEQKDSLEHIVRAYTRYSQGQELLKDSDIKYVKKNLDKAFGHTFRAFFDCADVYSIILREKLTKELANFSYSKILSVWKDYEEKRKFLVDVPQEIAKLRKGKDIAKDQQEIVSMVEKYQKIIVSLFDIYDTYMKQIYPLLNK